MSQAELDDSQVSENPEPPAKNEAAAREREYVVLEAVGQGTWKEVKKVLADDPNEAKASLGEANLKDTLYVAVAGRYWNPTKPKIETTTTITFE